MDTFQIYISTRLKNNSVALFLTELGVDVRYLTLRRGDFALSGRFGVKFLLRDEFIQSIKNRSIYREILELKREYADPVLIVEGENPVNDPEVNLATIQGAVLFASVLHRVPILTTKNEVETAQMIFMMAAQTSKGIDWKMAAFETDRAHAAEDKDHGDPRIAIIARLPEVGPALAQGLLKHFGSLSKLFAARISDLKKVEGIGPKRAARIFAFLNGNKAA